MYLALLIYDTKGSDDNNNLATSLVRLREQFWNLCKKEPQSTKSVTHKAGDKIYKLISRFLRRTSKPQQRQILKSGQSTWVDVSPRIAS